MNIQNYQCSQCEYKSYFRYHVATHIAAKHKDSGGRAKKIGCKECKENVTHKKCQTAETSQKRTLFRCTACDFETKQKSYLSRHTKLLHEPNADPSKVLTCAKCEYETKKKMCMTRHKNAQHANEKRFACNLCDFKSFYKHHVKQHITHNHKDTKTTEVRKLKCPECQKDIAHISCRLEKKTLKRQHLFKKEDGKHLIKTPPALEVQNLQCKDCSFETRNSSYMKRHTYLLHELKTAEALIIACTSCGFQTVKVA